MLDWRNRLEIYKQKKKKAGICWEEKRKQTLQAKQKIQTKKRGQKVMAKIGRLKTYRDTIKQIRQSITFQNNEREFYQQVVGECTKTYKQLDVKEDKLVWSKIWERKEHDRRAE